MLRGLKYVMLRCQYQGRVMQCLGLTHFTGVGLWNLLKLNVVTK